ncbi:MAG: hypothetical protein R3C40_03305 [Parvularculaceae bacterium]
MADDLDANLSNEDMRDLAGYTVGLSRRNIREAIDQLLEIENPRRCRRRPVGVYLRDRF